MSREATSHSPNPYTLSAIALARFRETFGEPNISEGSDHQWSLKTSPFGNDINVLINGSDTQPIVWIFDPNDRADGVSRSVIEQEQVISNIVDHIRDRVNKASRITRMQRDQEISPQLHARNRK